MSKGLLRFALLGGTALTFLAAGVPAFAESSTEALVAVLASKGVISPSEARSIKAAPRAAQEGRLVSLLRKKGVLADDDLKSLQPQPAGLPVEVTNPPASAAASRPASTAEAAPAAGAMALAPEPVYRKAAVNVGGFEITPVGYIALTSVTRSTNTGNNLPTSFGAIPFENTVQGNIGETRLSAQATRLGLRAHSTFGPWADVTGYFEGDFLGNDAANVFVSTNSHTFRMRLAYADVMTGPFEYTAGQVWSWITPNRRGLGPDPKDVFTTLNIDPGIQVGLPFARQAAAHLAWHPTNEFAIGVGVENPEQFVGVGEVIFPFAFNAQLGPQFDAGNNAGTPNAFPDVVGKATYDTDVFDRHVHLEAAGMWRTFKDTTLPFQVGGGGGIGVDFSQHQTNGWIATGTASVELLKGFTVLGNYFWGNGGSRYLAGLGPDVVVVPVATAGGAFFDTALSTVQSQSFLFGAEWQATPKTILAGYYGQNFFNNNAPCDITSPIAGTCNGKPFIGFGGTNSPNAANKFLQEWTADIKHTWWSDPRYGAVQSLAQYSYVAREPWFIPAGAPPTTHVHMFFSEFRYLFPG